MPLDLRVRFPVDHAALSALHAQVFDHVEQVAAWGARLARHSVSWVGAFERDALVGFVHACWDGGEHAFLLDTCVAPRHRGRGVGAALVRALADEARAAGCTRLHVDHSRPLDRFYLDACGFRPSAAGVLALAGPPSPATRGEPTP